MKLYAVVGNALRTLARNPMRAMLTTLGIVIGVGSVIAMMEIGSGSSEALKKSIANMGANMLMVFPGMTNTGGVSGGMGSAKNLTPDDCAAIIKECPAIRAAAPLVWVRAQAVRGNRNWVPQQIMGTTADYLEVRGNRIEQGVSISQRDILNCNRVCLIGKTVAQNLFDNESPVNQEIRLKSITFRVIGVLAPKGANMVGQDQDDVILAPWTTVKYRISSTTSSASTQGESSKNSTTGSTRGILYHSATPDLYPARSSTQAEDSPISLRLASVNMILASAVSPEAIPAAIDQITILLRERHRLRPDSDDDFIIRDMTEMTNTLSSTTKLMTNLLLCVAMISLMVGGVGIMNIMLVSVTERTREIGLRMAVGARSRDILTQFLVEAIVLCLIGGLIGILLGHGGAMLVAMTLHWPVATSIPAILAAFLVSASVGIIFGYYPAWKASRLDPIEALRYE
ncbi:MAG: ABC transporter permease [Victivallales bacterium]|nr:ABC transporter permease [Victivallales bacterium]